MPIDDKFYRAFEEKFRGSEEEIRRRLEFYTPLLKVYAEAYPSSRPKALDIGCGRGEMLSLYKDYGFEAFGIDINKEFVEYSKSKGFDVAYADALDFLKSQEDNTYDIISLIHVLEHLSFEYAFELHKEVLRVLKPGGSLILEFPFAENLAVGTIGFWTDPTHLKPLYPETVAFSLSYVGFVETVFFGINGGVKDLKDVVITDILTNYVAPDVTVIGIKDAQNLFFIERVKTALGYLKSRSSYRLLDILESASANIEKKIKEDVDDLINTINNQNIIIRELKEHINALKVQNESIKQELDDRFNNLNALVLFVKSQIEMLTLSKPWRMYTFLGKIKRKLFKKKINNISNIEKVDNEASIVLQDTQQHNNEKADDESILMLHTLSPVAKKIYNKLKSMKSL